MYTEGNHPLYCGGGGEVAVHAIVDPEAEDGGDLEGDFVDAD